MRPVDAAAARRGRLGAACCRRAGDSGPRVPRLQPGTGHAAQGRHAARPVARHPARAAERTRSSRRCSTTCTRRCGPARRCRTRSPRTGRCFPASTRRRCMAGEKSGSLETVLRRYVAYVKVIAAVKRRTDLGAHLPGRADRRWRSWWSASSWSRSCPSSRTSTSSSARDLPLVTRVIVARLRRSSAQRWLIVAGADRLAARGLVNAWLRRPGQRERFDRLILALPGIGPTARKFATSQLARTLATLLGGGIPLVNAHRDRRRSIVEPVTWRTSMEAVGQPRSRRGVVRGGDGRPRRLPGRGREDGRGGRSRPARSRRCSTAWRTSTTRRSRPTSGGS